MLVLAGLSSIAIGAASLIATPASAQGTPQQQADCTADAFRLCNAQIPDAKAVEICLRRNYRNLSPSCKKEFRPPPRKKRVRRPG
jgi:hypothetical protein